MAVTVVFERRAGNPGYSGDSYAFHELPVRRLVWPGELRPPGASLHAKLIVVDRSVVLVGSANLTSRAMFDNLECGVVIRDEEQAAGIAEHLHSLVRRGTLIEPGPVKDLARVPATGLDS